MDFFEDAIFVAGMVAGVILLAVVIIIIISFGVMLLGWGGWWIAAGIGCFILDFIIFVVFVTVSAR